MALPAWAQSGGKELTHEQLNEAYRLCTFPVPNSGFSVQHVNDVIAACTTLINTSGGSAENRALVHLQRGAMYRRLGKFELALSDFTMSLHYDPKSAYAYTGRGNAHRGLHQVDEAIADHTKAIELDPDYADAYNNRGNAWDDKEDYKRAVADFDQAIKLNLGDSAGAIADYSEAIKIDPRYAVAYFNRANAEADKGDKTAAANDYQAALKINPNFEQAAGALKELRAKR